MNLWCTMLEPGGLGCSGFIVGKKALAWKGKHWNLIYYSICLISLDEGIGGILDSSEYLFFTSIQNKVWFFTSIQDKVEVYKK